MEFFWHHSKIARWVSSIPFKTPLDLNEGVFKGVNFLGWGVIFDWFKSSAVCQCVLYKIFSWACYLDFCSVVVSKNVQKWDTLVASFTFSTVLEYSTVGFRVQIPVWYFFFLKKLIPQSYQWWAKQPFFVLFVFVNHWQCVKLFYFFQFCTLFLFLLRQNFTGANNLTKKWGVFFEIMNLVVRDREKKYK